MIVRNFELALISNINTNLKKILCFGSPKTCIHKSDLEKSRFTSKYLINLLKYDEIVTFIE